MTVNNTS